MRNNLVFFFLPLLPQLSIGSESIDLGEQCLAGVCSQCLGGALQSKAADIGGGPCELPGELIPVV